MDSITHDVSEYWLNQTKTLILTNLVSVNSLNDTMKKSLSTLYNQVTLENSLESFNLAKQIITEPDRNNFIIRNEWFKNIIMAIFICNLIMIIIGYLPLSGAYYDKYIKPIVYGGIVVGGILLYIYLLFYIINSGNI
jgi:hypothetical protein